MTIKATKNNGKGKRPSESLITLEGRNAYGTRHISVLLSNLDGTSTYNLLNIHLDSIPEFLEKLKIAYNAAKGAADTTPEKYRERQALTQTVSGTNQNDLQAIVAAVIQAMGVTKAETKPEVEPEPQTSGDDLDAAVFQNLLEILKPKAGKRSTNKAK